MHVYPYKYTCGPIYCTIYQRTFDAQIIHIRTCILNIYIYIYGWEQYTYIYSIYYYYIDVAEETRHIPVLLYCDIAIVFSSSLHNINTLTRVYARDRPYRHLRTDTVDVSKISEFVCCRRCSYGVNFSRWF